MTRLFLALVLAATPALAQTPPLPPPGPAGVPFTVTPADIAFFDQVKAAVASSNQQWLASVVNYPLKIMIKSGPTLIRDKTQFVNNYAVIIDAAVRQAVTFQSDQALVKTPAGIKVGTGQIWYQQVLVVANGMAAPRYLITAINN